MNPPSFLYWLGGTAILMGIIGLIGLLALWVDHAYQRHIEKRHGAPKEEHPPDVSSSPDNTHGRTRVWVVFEVLSAVFVVTALLTMIYSDSQLLRAIGGTAYVVVVSVAAAVYARSER